MDETPPGLDTNFNARHKVPKPRSRSRDSTEKLRRNNTTEDERSGSNRPDITENYNSTLKAIARKPDTSQKMDDETSHRIEVKAELCNVSPIKQEPLDYREMIQNQSLSVMIVAPEDGDANDLRLNTVCSDGDSNSSSNSGPFIPPAASGKVPLSIEKPPSEIFLQELDKFIKTTLKGGCLCLAEFKEILQLRQQGMFFYIKFFVLIKFASQKIYFCMTLTPYLFYKQFLQQFDHISSRKAKFLKIAVIAFL